MFALGWNWVEVLTKAAAATYNQSRCFTGMEPLFANRTGWRRLYPDLPGMGKTRAADWITCHDQVLDLVIDFIDTVAPGERFVVAGTSHGGYLARGLVYDRGAQMDGLLLTVPNS